MRQMNWLLAVGFAFLCGCGGGGDDPGGDSSFDQTFVPGQSLGGVLLGDTYASVVAAHGEPRTTLPLDDIGLLPAFYGETIMISFADTDGNGQLSPPDTVQSIMGISAKGQGVFRCLGVGTGSTPAEVIAVFGHPVPTTSIDTIFFYRTENKTNLAFLVYEGKINMIIVSKD